MKSEVKFEVKNGAYNPASVNDQVVQRIYNCLFPGWLNDDEPSEQADIRDKITRLIAELDLSHYYMDGGKGAKVTKPIKKILLQLLPKAKVEATMPTLCKKIAELYSPKMDIRAFWGDKALLGSGRWERTTTCFADDGCNKISRIFLEKFKRTKALVLESMTVENDCTKYLYARCIAFFAGGRNIYLSNFYWNGLPQNNLLFVEALRRLVGIPSVKYAKAAFPLPIYVNQDGLKVYDEDSRPYKGRIFYPCPHCDEKVPDLTSYTSGNTHHIGCSPECAGTSGSGYTCERCGEEIDEDDHYHSPNGEDYCQGCYDSYVAYCECCNNDVWVDNYLGDGYCDECGFICHQCDSVYSSSDHHEGPDRRDYCECCYDDKFVECCECGAVMKRTEAREDQDCYFFCADCYDDKYLECEECGKEMLRERAKDNLCEDCYADRQKILEEEADENATVNA